MQTTGVGTHYANQTKLLNLKKKKQGGEKLWSFLCGTACYTGRL